MLLDVTYIDVCTYVRTVCEQKATAVHLGKAGTKSVTEPTSKTGEMVQQLGVCTALTSRGPVPGGHLRYLGTAYTSSSRGTPEFTYTHPTHRHTHIIKHKIQRDWRVGSVVKRTYCSCKGPWFGFYHPHDGSQPSVTSEADVFWHLPFLVTMWYTHKLLTKYSYT